MISKGDFAKHIETQELGHFVNVSFSETREKPPARAERDPQECLAVQVTQQDGSFTCGYLGMEQVDELIRSLQDARRMWFANW